MGVVNSKTSSVIGFVSSSISSGSGASLDFDTVSLPSIRSFIAESISSVDFCVLFILLLYFANTKISIKEFNY